MKFTTCENKVSSKELHDDDGGSLSSSSTTEMFLLKACLMQMFGFNTELGAFFFFGRNCDSVQTAVADYWKCEV
jgi:hypothetical protein